MQQRDQHRVHEAGLARSGRTGDQQVGRLGQVRGDEPALDVLAEPDHQRVVVGPGIGVGHHVAEPDHLPIGVRHLDAHRRLARDRGKQPDVVGGRGIGDVAGQRGDLLDLDARAEFDLVAGDRRSSGEAGDGRVDGELVQHAGDPSDHLLVGRRPGLRRGAELQHARRWELVGPVQRSVQRQLGRRGDRGRMRIDHRATQPPGRGLGGSVDRADGRQVQRGGRCPVVRASGVDIDRVNSRLPPP